MKAIIRKSTYGGNRAESMTEADVNGGAWQITTTKNGRGQIVCSAVLGHDDGQMFSFDMFGAKRLTLATAEGRATEKLVRETHEKGIEEFNRIQSEQKETAPAPYVLTVGQILYTDGPFESRRRAICEILRPGKFKSVLLDGSAFTYDDHVKPIADKFGIGTYYEENDKISAEEVAELVQRANVSQTNKREEELKEKNEKEEERKAAIEAGRKLIPEIPAGAVAVIVAELHQDESDGQSDYFNYSTKDVVYLSFSSHTKDIFSEMRKAAAKFEPTQIYAVPPAKPEGTSESWTPKDEHREKYSMGSGYYLGESKYHGWIVKKRDINRDRSETLKNLQIAAANGKFYCNVEEVKEEPAPVQYEAQPVKAGELSIIDYSEKAIAVIGDTKPLKDQLYNLGGTFNARLSCGPGWIFSKKRLEAVQKFLQNISAVAV